MCWWWWRKCKTSTRGDVMAWLIVDPFSDSGGSQPPVDSNWLPWWNITSGQAVVVPTRKQYILHQRMQIDGSGSIQLTGSSELIVKI